jgi:membrane protein involved in colicin uptake
VQELELQRLHAATAAAKRQLKAATRACLDDLLTRYSTTSTSGSAGGGTGASGSSTWMSPWAR